MATSAERARRWYEKNRELHLARCQAYYYENKEALATKRSAYSKRTAQERKLSRILGVSYAEARKLLAH